MKALGRLTSILWLFKGEVFLSLVLGVAAIAAAIGLLGTSAFLIASAALRPSIADLQVAIVGVRFFGISRGVFRYLERLVSHSVNLRVLSRLREAFYRRVEPGAPANLVSYRSGDVLQRVMGDLETLENFYVRVISPLVVALVVIIGVSLFVGGYALQLGLILAAGLIITGFVHPLLSLLVSRQNIHNLAQAKAAAGAQMVELLQGLEDLQSCNAQARYINALQAGFNRTGKLQNHLTNIGGISSGLTLLFTNLTILALLWAAIPLVGEGSFTGISLAVITLVALASFEAAAPLPAAALNLNASRVAAQRLFSIGEETAESNVEPGGKVHELLPVVKMEKVSFSFEPEQDLVLDEIDLHISPGRRIAVIGASGAGKTSLINIMLGFEKPVSGRVTIGDLDLCELEPGMARSIFAVLPQSVYLFDDTLRGNLLLAKTGAVDEEIFTALDRVALGDWVNALPEGLDTWIGEHGLRMSGGERQRLAIARVLLQDKPIILMDEPTANLDRATAQLVMNNLFAVSAGKGVLLVTHDLDLLPQMDEIIVLSGARIAQRGTLEALGSSEGVLRKLLQWKTARLNED